MCKPREIDLHVHTSLRSWILRGLTVFSGLLVPLVCLELLLWFLPVHGGVRPRPVNENNPIDRYEPNRQFIWSRDFYFSIVNPVRINNFGFVSDFDYDPSATSPLLAVIGDSFVEAFMVPFSQTCAGRLAKTLSGTARIYPFGVSRSPLSQYLAVAEYTRETFQPDALAVIIIDNDYDNSLAKYGYRRGMHQFVEGPDGGLLLKRQDREPSSVPGIIRASALYRYWAGNLAVGWRILRIPRVFLPPRERELAVVVDQPALVEESKRAVDAFLERLPEASGVDTERVLFIVDCLRPELYNNEGLRRIEGSYFDTMRQYFMVNAAERGYEVIDMQPIFGAHYARHGERFEWAQDAHWNALGHELCSQETNRSTVVRQLATPF